MTHFKCFLLCTLLGAFAGAGIQNASAQTWTTVALGAGHTVALKSDSTVWAWGLNTGGQLGNGTNTNSSFPVQIKQDATTFLSGITAITAGGNYTVALKNDGTVWAWGNNGDGQLGNGTTTGSNSPVQVKQDATSFLSGITTIAAGAGHTVALKSDGTVWAWGYNQFGALGDGTFNSSSFPVQVNQDATTFLNGITAVAAGDRHTMALKSDGTVWTWGLNTQGQLGNGISRATIGGGTTPVTSRLPVQVKQDATTFLSGITAIAAGAIHTMALKNDGTVWTWGNNTNGQLGIGTITYESPLAIQVKQDANTAFTGITAIAAGIYHTAALKNDGTVWAWGYNNAGQLGNGTSGTNANILPVQAIVNATGSLKVATGSQASHTAILRNGQHTIFLTGLNTSGQLGSGATANSNIFTSINCGGYVGLVTDATTFSSQTLPSGGTALELQSACYLATSITPDGTSPVSGEVTARVWIEATEPTTTSSVYTRRHYEIMPAANAGNATARVTLYALQSEFSNYNSVSTQPLPASPTDAAGINRLRIYQYSGTSSNGTGLPGTYTGTPVIIDPADAAVVWNSTGNYWQISFDVTGFSGFFIGADNAVILPVKLTDFTATRQATASVLSWKVAQEENIAMYTIERSGDGRRFTAVGSVVSLGNMPAANTYRFTDVQPVKGANYYRLKINEKDGKVSYSEVRLLNFGTTISIALYPNPVKNYATITGVEAGMTIRLLNAVGQIIITEKAFGNTVSLPMGAVPSGLYQVQMYGVNGQPLSNTRLVKE